MLADAARAVARPPPRAPAVVAVGSGRGCRSPPPVPRTASPERSARRPRPCRAGGDRHAGRSRPGQPDAPARSRSCTSSPRAARRSIGAHARLDQRAALIETAAAADLEQQIARLSALRDEIAARDRAARRRRGSQARQPGQDLRDDEAQGGGRDLRPPRDAGADRVVERMREAKSADVLARMDPVKARQVTTELARRTELLEAGPRRGRRRRAEPLER